MVIHGAVEAPKRRRAETEAKASQAEAAEQQIVKQAEAEQRRRAEEEARQSAEQEGRRKAELQAIAGEREQHFRRNAGLPHQQAEPSPPLPPTPSEERAAGYAHRTRLDQEKSSLSVEQ